MTNQNTLPNYHMLMSTSTLKQTLIVCVVKIDGEVKSYNHITTYGPTSVREHIDWDEEAENRCMDEATRFIRTTAHFVKDAQPFVDSDWWGEEVPDGHGYYATDWDEEHSNFWDGQKNHSDEYIGDVLPAMAL